MEIDEKKNHKIYSRTKQQPEQKQTKHKTKCIILLSAYRNL